MVSPSIELRKKFSGPKPEVLSTSSRPPIAVVLPPYHAVAPSGCVTYRSTSLRSRFQVRVADSVVLTVVERMARSAQPRRPSGASTVARSVLSPLRSTASLANAPFATAIGCGEPLTRSVPRRHVRLADGAGDLHDALAGLRRRSAA